MVMNNDLTTQKYDDAKENWRMVWKIKRSM